MNQNIADTLQLDKKPAKKKWWLLLLAAAAGAALWFFLSPSNGPKTTYKTVEAANGSLTVTVSATGTLEPVTEVEVGIEVSGTVEEVAVDYNDLVKKGQVLARLDTEKLEARVLQSRANLEAGKAKLLEADATVAEAQNELDRLRRVRELSGGKLPSPHEMDGAEASLKRAEAARASAKAAIAQYEAALRLEETDLSKAVVRSPVDGIVLERKIEPGQTVAATLQTPVLFTLAENLTQMELHVFVDEADVGKVKTGQPAVFTVDAFGERKFPAVITQVRYAPQTVDGVVTYETLLAVDNRDLSLRPGMTATAEITVETLENGLLIPNAVLRFAPPAEAKEEKKSGVSLMPGPPRSQTNQHRKEESGKERTVWALEEGKPVPVAITTGLTDGKKTQVIDGLEPGETLITEMTVGGK